MLERSLSPGRTARYLVSKAGPAPEVWIAFHGYGQSVKDFATSFAPIADPDRLIVIPEGLSRFYTRRRGSGEVQPDDVGASWMTREKRDEEITDYVRWIDTAFSDALARAGLVTAERLVVLGFSQGAHTACRWLARSVMLPPERCHRVILWGAGPPEDLDLDTHARWLAGRLTLVAGTNDRFAAPETVARHRDRLRVAGLEPVIVRYEGGHEIDATALARLVEK